MRKIILKNFQSPGDITMLAYAVKALHESFPKEYLTDVRTSTPDIFIGNPYISKLEDGDPEAEVFRMEYPTIHMSNQYPVQFVNSFIRDLSVKLDTTIWPTTYQNAIFMLPSEVMGTSKIFQKLGRDVPYWVLAAGYKTDFTCKAWAFERYQQLVSDHPDVWFVQVGQNHDGHVQPTLNGSNVINLVGKTSCRELINLVYHSFGVIGHVSFPMHLSYAVPVHTRFRRGSRACIVIAGGRESPHWEQGPNHHFLHTCGMLDCCSHGGCWKSRVVPVGDGDKKDKDLCRYPIPLIGGQTIPKCMEMISVEDVSRILDKFMANLEYEPRF